MVEANKVSSGDLIGSRPSTSSTEIKSRAEGIFQNLTDPTQVYDEHVNIGTWIIATGLVWAVSGISIGTLFMVRRKRSDATWMRRQHVRQSVQLALERARESNTQGRQKEALYHLRSALTGSFANVHENIPSPQTSADVASVASLTTANPDDQIQLLQLLEAIEAAEYSGIQSIDTTAAIDSATKLIDRLKPHLLRKKTERGIA